MMSLAPHLYSAFLLAYGRDALARASLSREKTQYVYRFLVLAEGELRVFLGGGRTLLRAGDLLYLPPGERYRLAADSPFSLYQVAFDLSGVGDGERPLSCVPAAELCAERLSSLPEGEDMVILRSGGVFSGTGALRRFASLAELDRHAPLWQFFADTALSSTLAELLRPAPPERHGGEEILDYIRTHPGAELSPASLAARFSYHPNYINSLVKQRTGLSLTAYLRRIKMRYARDLFTHGGLSPAEVAAALGYYDYSHFYKAFRAEMGCSPTSFREKRG